LTTLNLCGMNVPANVPVPSAFWNVPVTVDVMLPGDAAGADAAVREVCAALVLAAPAAVADIPTAMAAVAAVTTRIRKRGALIGSLSVEPALDPSQITP
jgi:hypothetical protein